MQRGRKAFFHDAPKGYPVHGLYLYAVEFTDGVVKVGQTFSPRQRLAQHRRAAMKRGAAICRYHVSEPVAIGWAYSDRDVARRAEKEVVRRLARIGNVLPPFAECFTNTPFPIAAQLCDQCTAKHRSPKAEKV